jgi:hypothetical protein
MDKYIKYKKKYKQLKEIIKTYKMNNFDIVDFLYKETFETIKNDLLNRMDNTEYCNKIIGQGMFGIVYEPFMNIKMNINQNIQLPVVIKESHIDGFIYIEEINNNLYIYGYKNITLEAIILSYINKLWAINPHLPYMIGYSMCNNKNKVDKIITHKQGLNKNIEIKLTNRHIEMPLWRISIDNKYEVFSSNISTLDHLLTFIMLNIDDNNQVKLPNNEICDVIELLNYLTISYICTHYFLYKNNIVCSDMKLTNIFIHWLDENSYLGDKIKFIYYKIDKKIIKIKTFGLILKIGDTGTFMINPRKNLYIIGHAYDLPNNYKLLKQMMKENYMVSFFLYHIKNSINNYLYNNIIISNILNAYPYNKLYGNIGYEYKLLNELLTPIELLEKYFSNYYVDNINSDTEFNLILKI